MDSHAAPPASVSFVLEKSIPTSARIGTHCIQLKINHHLKPALQNRFNGGDAIPGVLDIGNDVPTSRVLDIGNDVPTSRVPNIGNDVPTSRVPNLRNDVPTHPEARQ